jgi:hypothetical protein
MFGEKFRDSSSLFVIYKTQVDCQEVHIGTEDHRLPNMSGGWNTIESDAVCTRLVEVEYIIC